MSECTHDCSTCSQNCGEREQNQSMLQKPHEQSHVKKIVAVCSGKGGVGKSLVTALLAVIMQRRGLKVGVLDADITGPSIPKAFGLRERASGTDSGIFPVKTKTGIDVMSLNLLLNDDSDPVAWRGPIIAGAVGQFWTDVIWGDKDIMFIDMPPGTGDVMLTVFQSIPVDGAVLVSTPQELVEMIVEKALKMTRMMDVPVIGLAENMSYLNCPDCGRRIEIFGHSRMEETAKKYDIPVTAALPIDPKLAGGVDKGLIELFEGDWLDGLADAIEALEPKKHD